MSGGDGTGSRGMESVGDGDEDEELAGAEVLG